jgi:DNA processing protein
MENYLNIKNLKKENWPQTLHEIPQPPKQLRIVGTEPDWSFKRLCIVGSRKYSDYGAEVCKKIISELTGYPISIVSGLAYGIDTIAHETALENKLHTIAIPGSGLSADSIYPRANYNLATEIIDQGGCLISEFPDDLRAAPWTFPNRNRIMVGITDATLIIECSEKSGTMITAALTLEYNHELMTIPGSIFDENSSGTNKLIKSGAHVIRNGRDVLEFFGFKKNTELAEQKILESLDDVSQEIFKILKTPKSLDEILSEYSIGRSTKPSAKNFSISQINESLSILEINNLITKIDGRFCVK